MFAIQPIRPTSISHDVNRPAMDNITALRERIEQHRAEIARLEGIRDANEAQRRQLWFLKWLAGALGLGLIALQWVPPMLGRVAPLPAALAWSLVGLCAIYFVEALLHHFSTATVELRRDLQQRHERLASLERLLQDLLAR